MTQRTCSVDGCWRTVLAKGLCKADYEHLRRTGMLELSVTRRQAGLDTETHKACVTCRQLVPRTDFYRSSKSKDGLRGSCKSCTKQANRSSYQANKSAVLERQRSYRETPERKTYMAEYLAHYIPANRDGYAERTAKRRALQRNALVDTGITIEGLKLRHGTRCVFCEDELLFNAEASGKLNPRLATIEHLTPLSRGGQHSWNNTALACHRCNVQKNNKTVDEFTAYRETAERGTRNICGQVI